MQPESIVSLAQALSTLPSKPGVYQYYDSAGKLLYIGKAKNLKNRVRSYFAFTQTKEQGIPIPNHTLSHRITLMVRQIAQLQVVVVDSEQDALILENSLIKQLKPKYNILLRDDKTYPYIAFDLDLDFPTPIITRNIAKTQKNVLYFGPYPSGCRDIVNSLLELFPLVQKSPKCVAQKKSCLFYQIQRCKAPCEGHISKQAYREILENALEVLKTPSKLLAMLKERMAFLSNTLRFEEAGIYRDRIKKLINLQSLSVLDVAKNINLDVLYFYTGESNNNQVESSVIKQGILLWLFVRSGKVVSFSSTIVRLKYDYDPVELYTQALLNAYAQKLPLLPDAIVLPDIKGLSMVEDFIMRAQGKKIPLIAPKRGEKAKILALAHTNAKEILHKHYQEQGNEYILLEKLKQLLNLDSIPFRIEVFDTSHHSGSDCVGGMVVYEYGEFAKSAYRRYKLQGSDEYSQIREMLTRRALKFAQESPPDLWLIDGGVAQIKLAREILDSSGANVCVVGIAKQKRDFKAYRAKGNARDTIYTLEKTLLLEPSNKCLQFLQKLRDEAHKYAISYHRHTKRKALTQRIHLQEDGLSTAQITRLLTIMGSYEAIKDLSKEEAKALLAARRKHKGTL